MTPQQGGRPRTPVPNAPQAGRAGPNQQPDDDAPPGEASSAQEEANRPCTQPSDEARLPQPAGWGGGREGQKPRVPQHRVSQKVRPAGLVFLGARGLSTSLL